MSQIIKAFTGIFMMLFIMVTTVGVMRIYFETVQAQNFHASLLYELESSNHALSVLKNGMQVGKLLNYEIEYSFIKEGGGVVVCAKYQEIPRNVDDVEDVEVVLRYPVQLGFLGIDTKQELIGYAR